eukprot:2172506-Ditylum_brightwellii.AAC.1
MALGMADGMELGSNESMLLGIADGMELGSDVCMTLGMADGMKPWSWQIICNHGWSPHLLDFYHHKISLSIE